jgi:hypothetical protein
VKHKNHGIVLANMPATTPLKLVNALNLPRNVAPINMKKNVLEIEMTKDVNGEHPLALR